MSQWRCKLFGHKPEYLSDVGVVVCQRCGSCEQWHWDEWDDEWFWWPNRLLWEIRNRWHGLWRGLHIWHDRHWPPQPESVDDDDIPF